MANRVLASGKQVQETFIVGADGEAASLGGKQEVLTLLSNASATGAPQSAYGGDYVWTVQGDFTGGGSVQLQTLGPDGSTYQNLGAAKTASDTAGGTGVGLGSNATVRAAVTGTVAAVYATLSRIP